MEIDDINKLYDNCVICGNRFEKRNNQITCSKECAKKRKSQLNAKLYQEKYKKDPECRKRQKDNYDKWYDKDTSKETIKRKWDNQKRRRKEIRLNYIKFMGSHCWLCDFSRYISTLEFHHVFGREFPKHKSKFEDPRSKVFKIKECILICSNCHQEYHFGTEISTKKIIEVWKQKWKELEKQKGLLRFPIISLLG